MSTAQPPTTAMISSRPIAEGADWNILDVVCRAGPADKPYEERHERVSIAAVVAGSFRYACDKGTALLYPGALMLGNAGSCFECGHQHSRGDRCVAFHYDVALFEEIAASAAGSSSFRFPLAMVPAMPSLLPTLVEVEALAGATKRLAAQSLAIRLAELTGGVIADAVPKRAKAGAGDERRISVVLNHIEQHADAAIDLETLAAMACMSKYHFLRVFRRVTGLTPYKFLLGVRMRRAAVKLRTSRVPVATIAFDAGFGDLSTFNNRFRDVFGVPPTRFRMAA